MKNFEKNPEAISFATKQAKKTDLGQIKIMGKDGKIQQERTYGDDPKEYKG